MSGARTVFTERDDVVRDCLAAGMVASAWRCPECGYRLRLWSPPDYHFLPPVCDGRGQSEHTESVMVPHDAGQS